MLLLQGGYEQLHSGLSAAVRLLFDGIAKIVPKAVPLPLSFATLQTLALFPIKVSYCVTASIDTAMQCAFECASRSMDSVTHSFVADSLLRRITGWRS